MNTFQYDISLCDRISQILVHKENKNTSLISING